MRRNNRLARILPVLLGTVLVAWLAGLGWRLARNRSTADARPQLSSPPNQAKGEPTKSEAYKLIPGPYEVDEVKELVLRDARRRKNLPVRILYPTGMETFPVIIFSHGAGGSKECCTELVRHWASYGYVVLLPTHADSVQLRRQQGEDVKLGSSLRGAIDTALHSPAAWANRARDISFLIDSLGELVRRVPALQGKMDAKRIGVGGHSLGAYTAQLIGGATVDMPEGEARSFADERVRVVLLLSGQGRGQLGLTDRSWDKLTRPMMTMTGSRDRGAGGQGPEWKKEPFDFSPAGDKYHIYIEGARHDSFIGGLAADPPQRTQLRTRAAAAGGPDQEAVFSYAQIATLAFWDAYLKSDEKARAYLQSDSLESYSDGSAKLYRK